MYYESLTKNKKSNINISDEEFQYSLTSQLADLNRTRKILITLTSIEFTISLLCFIVVIYAYVFGFTLGVESYNPIIRFLPLVSCICFFIGLFAADRYHVKGLFLFTKLVMLDLLLTYVSLTIFIIIPICLKEYTINIASTIIFVMSYHITFCLVSFLPGCIIYIANKLSNLLADNKFSTIK